MNKNLKAILVITASAATVASIGAIDALLQIRTQELREINLELALYGIMPEGTLSNARAVVEQEREKRKTAQEFVDIINFNYSV